MTIALLIIIAGVTVIAVLEWIRANGLEDDLRDARALQRTETLRRLEAERREKAALRGRRVNR